MSDYFDELDSAIEAESQSQSAGIIALCRVEVGYKVYTGSVPQSQSFFPCSLDETSRNKAKAKAAQLAQQVGANRAPTNLTIRILAQKDGAFSKGAPVTWQDDRHFCEDVWKNKKTGDESDGQKLLPAALKALGLKLPCEQWLRLQFVNSPSGRKETDKRDNSERNKSIAVPVEVFKTKADALQAVAKSANGTEAAMEGTGPTFETGVPEGYTPDSWASQKEAFLKAYQAHVQTLKGAVPIKRKAALEYVAENEAGSTPEQLAELIGV